MKLIQIITSFFFGRSQLLVRKYEVSFTQWMDFMRSRNLFDTGLFRDCRLRKSASGLVFALALMSCGGADTGTPVDGAPPSAPPTGPAPTPPPAPPSTSELIDAARAFPAMAKGLAELLNQGLIDTATFASGTPYNDLEYTLFDTDYIEGETDGHDTFMPVDPSDDFPGSDRIQIVNAVNNLDLDSSYDGPSGDRIILGTAEIAVPFYSAGADGVDNDYLIITNFDYSAGQIQLRGSASDYGLVRCGPSEGCDSDGYYLFHIAFGTPDLIAFIHPCDEIALPLSGLPPRDADFLCNASGELSLFDARQFRFASPLSTTPTLPGRAVQLGTDGKEIIGGSAMDSEGNLYILGATDGDLGSPDADHAVVVHKLSPDGLILWTHKLELSNGSLLFDAVADDTYLYAVGRTLGALPGFENRGRWDGIILKMRLSDGEIVAANQFGNEGLDGYGNVVLDDAGNLYVSGAGSPPGSTGTDDAHLVAKHRASDLGNVWREIVAPRNNGPVFVSEAWGGLSYIPSNVPGGGRLVAGGWFMSTGGADAFLEVWSELDQPRPRRTAATVISSPGTQADWVLDNAVDAAGNIYAVGYTTGSLGDSEQGNGDAYIVKFDPGLANPRFVQLGTAQSDAFRKLVIGDSGNLIALGYSYGDFVGSGNTDSSRRTGDVILASFDQSLNPLARLMLGSSGEDRGYLSINGARIGIAGMTEGALGSTSAGSFDFFAVFADANGLIIR